MPYRVILAVHKLVNNAEEITATLMCLILHININWADKIVGAFISVSFSLFAGFMVSLIKKKRIKERLLIILKRLFRNGKKD